MSLASVSVVSELAVEEESAGEGEEVPGLSLELTASSLTILLELVGIIEKSEGGGDARESGWKGLGRVV